jgi:hypothetical protein
MTVRRKLGRLVAVTAVVVAALATASSAGATTYSWNVAMDATQQCASHLPCDAGASGTALITADTNANQVCGTFNWSGIHGAVGFGHIHQAEAGVPENVAFTINLVGPPTSTSGFQSPVSGCTIVPTQVQSLMARFPQEFMVTIHTTSFPGGAIRGQLGGGNLICELNLCPGPIPTLAGSY